MDNSNSLLLFDIVNITAKSISIRSSAIADPLRSPAMSAHINSRIMAAAYYYS